MSATTDTTGDPADREDIADGWVVRDVWDDDLRSTDPLGFPGYDPPAADQESVRTGLVQVRGRPAVFVECRFDRQGGTMGAVAGERIVRAFDRATRRGLPVVEIVASGGARLQEGTVALVQMARTVSAAAAHARAGLLTAAVLRGPVSGGVYASWASVAQIRAAEPGAVIGFGGPRVVAEVTGSRPPADSHTAESAYAHGHVDALVPRPLQRHWLAAALGHGGADPLVLPPGRPADPASGRVPADPWRVLLRARAADRPSGLEWAAWLTDTWVELHGPDPGIRAGLAEINGARVVVVATDRHVGTPRTHRPGPAAFALAERAVRLADQLELPLLSVVDTPGADPGPTAEAGGVAGRIAALLTAMSELRSPSVALCVGEGGSGGAMALAYADRLLVLDGAVFPVIGPEAGAAVLYRDAGRAPELTRSLAVTAPELLRLGVVDGVVTETRSAVRAAVLDALGGAWPGERLERVDRATRRALAG